MFGNRLKRLREEMGYTQESLGDKLQISLQQISRHETGGNAPSSTVVARIAHVLNVSTDYLLGLTDDPTPPEFRGGALSTRERAALSAWRRGDKLEAVRVIVSEE